MVSARPAAHRLPEEREGARARAVAPVAAAQENVADEVEVLVLLVRGGGRQRWEVGPSRPSAQRGSALRTRDESEHLKAVAAFLEDQRGVLSEILVRIEVEEGVALDVAKHSGKEYFVGPRARAGGLGRRHEAQRLAVDLRAANHEDAVDGGPLGLSLGARCNRVREGAGPVEGSGRGGGGAAAREARSFNWWLAASDTPQRTSQIGCPVSPRR